LAIVIGLAAGIVFVRRQHRLADPLLDLRLFRNISFTAALTSNLFSFFVGFGILLFIAQYLQLVLGLSPLVAGLWMLPSSAALVVGSLLTPALTRNVRPAFVMAGGLILAAAGLGLFMLLGSSAGLGIVVAGTTVFSLAVAPVDTLATDLAVGAAPPERAGSVSALAETSSELGGALGIAILGVIGTSVYRGQLAGALTGRYPSHVVAAARDTLGGAVMAAARLPGQPGEALAGAARHAFTQGLRVAFAVCAAVLLVTAVFAATRLRHVAPATEPEPEPGAPAGDTGNSPAGTTSR
jgi:DHA2 family multidrug resistance protein-like MFS transporter